MDIIGFLKEWVWVLNLVPALVLVIGVPAFILLRRRRLARMTPAQQQVSRAKTSAWLDEMMDPTNLSGWTNPDSGAYAGIRHDDD